MVNPVNEIIETKSSRAHLYDLGEITKQLRDNLLKEIYSIPNKVNTIIEEEGL